MYRQNSEKHYWGGGGQLLLPPPPPPLATLVELCYVLCGKAKFRLLPLVIFIEVVSTTKQLDCEDNDEINY